MSLVQEEWAFSVQGSISKMQKQAKTLMAVIHCLRAVEESQQKEGPRKGLGQVMIEAINSSVPPTLKRVDAVQAAFSRSGGGGEVRCSVTGTLLELECLELRGPSKPTGPDAGSTPDPPLVVHPDLEHFFLMLWYICKMEHVVRSIAKNWKDEYLASRPQGEQDDDDGDDEDSDTLTQTLCEKFSSEYEGTILDMHFALEHAISHVLESVYTHQCMVDANLGQGKKKKCSDVVSSAAKICSQKSPLQEDDRGSRGSKIRSKKEEKGTKRELSDESEGEQDKEPPKKKKIRAEEGGVSKPVAPQSVPPSKTSAQPLKKGTVFAGKPLKSERPVGKLSIPLTEVCVLYP